eukprot:Seg4191.5 transcript_id=Seg4191.5/GoldUCD/mRNA.D3Y31 product="hypothetical protein" protein_id=Seg4191.5/GoldUCD/D3Y31
MKSEKSSGNDNIPAKQIKAGGEPVIDAFDKFFNLKLTSNKAPDCALSSSIAVIFKKGDRHRCSNYRPISLLIHIYKHFMMIIANRIKPDTYREIPPSQAAYQPNRGTTEHISSLQQIIEKS